MNDKRPKNQLQMTLAFTGEGRREAPRAPREGTESLAAKCETESPAGAGQRMEEVCGRENCPQALRLANSPALQSALPMAYFDSLGLPRLLGVL